MGVIFLGVRLMGLFFLLPLGLQGQSYFNELGKRITYADYEQKILSGPYFGVPGEKPGDQKLVHRMPTGLTNARLFYEKLGMLADFQAGRSLVVIFYPGKDECNSAVSTSDPKLLRSNHEAVLKYAQKFGTAPPVYLYQQAHGLEKYAGIHTWIPDPEGVFARQFFQFPYPCKSFVVISPKGNYRAILGEFPISQISVALKKL
ncbi:MAG: hypothetical protein NBV61_02105 [Algoriphagus sp.]|nr:hypothetical protein [Algoriphagus sp.]